MANKKYFSNGIIVDLEDSYFLGEGIEGKSYRLGAYVFKINYNNCISTLKEPDIKKLYSISLQRFVLPTDIIRDEDNKYAGYVKRHITKTKDNHHLQRIDKKQLLKILSLFKEDIAKLSNFHFKVDDFNLDNCIFNEEGLFFIDPGFLKYSVEDNLSENNLSKLRTFFVEIIYETLKNSEEDEYTSLNTYLQEEDIDVIDFVEKEMKISENLKSFGKRIIGK